MHLLKITKFKIIVSLIFIGQTIYLQGQATNSSYFITTWNTEAGDPGGTSFKLPLSGGTYDVDRNNDGDFDDANEANQTGTITIDFGVGNAGRKTIAVRPNPTNNTSKQLRISHLEGGDAIGTPLKLTSIDQWGDIVWTSMENAFRNCSNLTIADDAGVPNLTMVTRMLSTFSRATNFNGNISTWDVSNVTNMWRTFWDATSFNGDISTWNISNVTDMTDMLSNANSFSSENYDALLTGWSNLTPQNNITFGAPPTTYCSGKAGRDILINTYNWDIRGDNGLDCTVTSTDEEFLSNTKIYPNPTNSKINDRIIVFNR